MAIRIGYNGQVSSGLTFAYDSADFFNSYIGEPTVNRIASPEINGYPRAGNGWGTYNTNRYYPFFSIGSVSSVSNNIVTTAGSHTMRSFDVLRPETSGGGVSTGINYLVKKISDTQFSLHEYNSSQDGSQGYVNPTTRGYKVHDSYWLDQRVSINAAGFPTSWVGEAHLPNAGLVKELITGGFDVYPSQKTDCIRQHVHRPDSVADHMAYGPDAAFTPNTQVTASFWSRSVTPSAVGQSINFYHYTYGQTGPTAYAMGAVLGPVGVWQRHSYQFTSPNSYAISYWFNPGGPYSYDIANIQIEQNSKATPFVAGTRSATQALLDVAGSAQINLSNMSYNNSGIFQFDGTDDFMSIGSSSQLNITNSVSIFAMVKIDNQLGWDGIFGTFSGGGFIHFQLYGGGLNCYLYGPDASYSAIDSSLCYLTPGQWTEVGLTFGNNTLTAYINGVALPTTVSGNGNSISGTSDVSIGRVYSSDRYFGGNIDVVRVYNRALSASEVSQNFNSYKKRFNL